MVHPLAGRRGPARTMAALARSVAKEYDVLVAAPEGYLTSAVRGTCGVRVRVLALHHSRLLSWLTGSAQLASLAWKEPRFDVIHANGLSALNLIGLVAFAFQIPVLVHFHHHAQLDLRARVLARVWAVLGVKILMCPVSDSARRTLRDARLRVDIGPNLPNTIEGIPIARDRQAHQPIAVGFLGSPLPRKGLHLLAEVAVILQDLDVQWLIFGIDPGTHDEYVDLCGARLGDAGLAAQIVWGGRVNDPDEAFERMDILLVPSLEESWCRVAMEGMAAGLPVVGTAIPGLWELLGLVEGAPTFAVDRPDEAATHIRRLAGDPGLRRTLGRRGRTAVHPFVIDFVGPQLVSLYRYLQGSAADPDSEQPRRVSLEPGSST
jgi:glycosyltransferase involved in cell wall biosynthesis